jgi:hypothetical protein
MHLFGVLEHQEIILKAAGLIATIPFLMQHCVPVLFEKEPPAPHLAQRPYLDSLRGVMFVSC